MVNPDEDILQQFVQEEPSESPLTLLAGNTATANDAPSGSLNAYRASGASVQPAKDPTEVFKQLHPEAATRIQRFFELADERGLGLKPGSMNRDYGTQAKMYANRASNPYPVAPPGGSAHMGFATDFSGYKPEKLQAIRELAKEVGLVYGGNWNGKSFDPVHIQLGPGNEVTRYIQGHIDPKAGSVNWEGVRTTALPEDFLKRAIAAAQGQNVPVKEVKVEGASNATGSVTAAAEPSVEEADAKVEVTKKRKDIDFAKLIKMLDDSTHGGADYLSRSMQANAQQAQANRSRSLAQIAQFDQEQVNKMAEALKGGKAQGYSEGGEFEESSTPAYLEITNLDKYKDLTSDNSKLTADFEPLNFDALLKAGAFRVTHRGLDEGYDPDPKAGFSLVSAYNEAAGPKTREWKNNPAAYNIVKEMFTQRPEDIGAHKYLQILQSAKDIGIPESKIFLSKRNFSEGGDVSEGSSSTEGSPAGDASGGFGGGVGGQSGNTAGSSADTTGGSPAGDASGGFGGGIGSGTSTSTESPSTGDISNGSGAGGNEIIPVSLMTSGPNTLTKLANSLESINAKYGVAPKIEDIVIKNNLAEGGKVKLHDLYYKYAEGGPKLPDRPEYEMTDNSNAVDATPNTSLEQLFQALTGGRNLQNDLSNIKSRLPTGQDYGHALLEQRDSTQAMNEQGRQNLREGYANRDIPQMLLGTGQGALGLISPAMAPINAGFEVLSKTAGKFDPRAKAEAERISLMGTEGTGAAHGSLKTLGDAIVKASERVKLPEASLIALPAAVAAAERPAEAVTRSLSPIGLYSHAAEMAEALPQAKGTPEQMRAMLFDKYGVKPAELEGFEEKFFGRPSVTKEELATHFRERMPQVEEKVRRGRYKGNVAELQAARDAAEARGDTAEADRIQASFERHLAGDAKFEKWSLPGGENYREVLLRIPSEEYARRSAMVASRAEKDKLVDQYGAMTDRDQAREFYPQVQEAIKKYNDSVRDFQNSPKSFTSSHWDDPNVLAHIRMSDRTGPKGEKLLHVEEMQSDWGQKGRKEGFVNPEEHVKWGKNARDIYQEVSNAQEAHRELTNRIAPTINEEFKAGRETPREYEKRVSNLIDARQDLLRSNPEWQASLKRVRDANDARNNISPRPSVPTAPYVTSTQGWTDLALKRVMKEAAEGGYDGVVFTPGAEQAKRYDLSKSISNVEYDPNSKTLQAIDHNRNVVLFERNVEPNKLPDFLGKEVAEKLMNEKNIVPYSDGTGIIAHELSGQDLSIGGEGMKGYYDKIVPTQLQKMVKGYDKDAKLGTMRTNSLPDMLHLPVTDKMREHILKGQKAYMRGGRVGYADGGLVADNADGTGRQQYDAYGNVSDSQGGPVHAVQYDPDRINMMAQQLHEGTYG